MKNRLKFALLLILVYAFASCNVQTRNDYSLAANAFLFKKYFGEKEQFKPIFEIEPLDNANNIIALVEGSIIYNAYSEFDNSLNYYQFDIGSNTTHFLGKIDSPFISSGSIAQIGGMLYFYMNKAQKTENAMGKFKQETVLYAINTLEYSLSSIYTEPIDQTLIYVEALDDGIIALKGKIDGDIGTTYIDMLKSDMIPFALEPSVVISSNYNNSARSGEAIYNLAQYNGYIYIVGVKADGNGHKEYFIRKVDSNGNQADEMALGEDIELLISNERISNFYVLDGYAFIRTFSGIGVFFSMPRGAIKPQLIGSGELDMAFMPSNSAPASNALLYSRGTGLVWLVDFESGNISELDLDIGYIHFIASDSNCHAIISAEKMLYIDYLNVWPKNTAQLIDLREPLIF